MIEDLLPGLMEHPLWEGEDVEFTAYVRAVFGVPHSFTRITVTPTSTKGRSAVAIGDSVDGAIIFAIEPNVGKQKTTITPILAGPVWQDQGLVKRTQESNGEDNSYALSGLLVRTVGAETALSLMAPRFQ